MDKLKELIKKMIKEYIKENLSVYIEKDEGFLTVKISLCGEVISESSIYIHSIKPTSYKKL